MPWTEAIGRESLSVCIFHGEGGGREAEEKEEEEEETEEDGTGEIRLGRTASPHLPLPRLRGAPSRFYVHARSHLARAARREHEERGRRGGRETREEEREGKRGRKKIRKEGETTTTTTTTVRAGWGIRGKAGEKHKCRSPVEFSSLDRRRRRSPACPPPLACYVSSTGFQVSARHRYYCTTLHPHRSREFRVRRDVRRVSRRRGVVALVSRQFDASNVSARDGCFFFLFFFFLHPRYKRKERSAACLEFCRCAFHDFLFFFSPARI